MTASRSATISTGVWPRNMLQPTHTGMRGREVEEGGGKGGGGGGEGEMEEEGGEEEKKKSSSTTKHQTLTPTSTDR